MVYGKQNNEVREREQSDEKVKCAYQPFLTQETEEILELNRDQKRVVKGYCWV
jgi:hypothetical protein